MKYLRFLLPLLLLFSQYIMAQQGDGLTVKQMVSDYENASNKQKRDLAPKIVQELIKEDVFYTPSPPAHSDMPIDTLDALVYYGVHCQAECFNDYAKGIEYGEKALPLLQDSHPYLYDAVLRGMTKCYQKKGDSQQALEWGKKAEAACKKHGDKRELSYTYSILSYIFTTMRKPQMAADYALAAIDESHQSGDTIIINSYYLSACDAYVELGDYPKSIEYGWKAVNAAKNMQVGPAITANHLALLGYVYYRADSLDAANKVLDEAFRLYEEAKAPPVEIHGALEFKAMVLMKQNRVDEAVQLLQKGIQICKDANDLRDESLIQHTLYSALRDRNPTEAMKALERYTELRDSIWNEDLKKQLSEVEASYNNEQLKSKNEAAEKRNRLILITSILVTLLLIGIIGMLIYAMRTRIRAVKTMQRLQRARERFFTNVTHEFRTPLTVIMGVANRLQKSISADSGNVEEVSEQKHSLALIERNGEQLLTLVNQLLDVAKATSAIGDLKYQNGNLVAYTNMVVESFQEPAKAKGIQLSFQPQETELHTAFVADYMQKILSNLLTNALKFTPSRGKVTVGMKKTGTQIQLTVSDTGQGISDEDVTHIFEPFYQGDHSQMGTGVGLSLVKQLVEAMEGTVTAESTEGQGATFIINLPIKEVKTEDKQEEDLDTQESKEMDILPEDKELSSTEQQDKKELILVVEDNADVAEYIGSVLSDEYEVQYATNGAEGIKRANELMPDLIVSDVMMPDVDGLELCRRIRSSEMTNHIPLVIITARVTDEDRLQGIKAGADAYLYKPFLADELLLRIEKLLESRRMLQRKFSKIMGDIRKQEVTPSEPQTLYERNVAKANEQFLLRLDQIIIKLMPKGECNVDKVADELCISRGQLARKVKAVIDTTPSDYILNYRLNEVKRLLHVQPPLTILEIAIKCGFADNVHLAHVFKQKLGITPTQYIKEKQVDELTS